MDELVLVGNYAVAGTNKFVSHALRVQDPHWITMCGLHLEYHTGQQWEELDNYKPTQQPGCIKCQRALTAMERRKSSQILRDAARK